jgi:MYXO-CTERM domain-containing protein
MTTYSRLVSGSIALFTFFTAALAGAEDDPCGKFDFTQGIQCTVEVQGGCKAECTPLNFEAACTGTCDASASVECTGSCEVSCNAKCNPATLDCVGSCDAECGSRCNAECALDDCSAECAATCNTQCDASCTGTAPTCEASCKESCGGACTAEANIDCDVDCYAELEGGCLVQCEEPSGALFCNGQYVAAADVDACIEYIQNNWDGTVDASARGTVTCDLNGCDSIGEAKIAWCSIANAGAAAGSSGVAAAAALAFGAALARRRRSSKK